MTRLRSLQEHLNRWMLAYVSLAILVGLLSGNGLARFAKSQAGLLGGLTTAAVLVIIYPMMVNVRFEALLRAGRNLRGIGIALLFNFVWAPLVGWVLATIFLSDSVLARRPLRRGMAALRTDQGPLGMGQGSAVLKHTLYQLRLE